MITTVIYSNSEYLDILNIQTKFVENIENKILFINKNDKQLDYIYNKFDKVIFYDDIKTYADRLNSCLSEIKNDIDYILLIHDIDILLEYDINMIESCLDLMINNNIDRCDLQWMDRKNKSFDINEDKDFILINDTENTYVNSVYLANNNYQSNVDFNGYIYNVNPSVWKVDTLLDITNKFIYKTYRTIEDTDVQNYCTKFKIYKLYSEKFIDTSYFKSVEFFQFLHITHGGMYMPIDNNANKLPLEIHNKYQDIIKEFNLTVNSPRNFRNNLH
jgi:hypothetical protein